MFLDCFICLVIALAALTAPAYAQLIEHKDLSLATALTVATAAADYCKAQGYAVSVAVVGREAQIIVQLRGDGSPPHSIENSYRRAYTALTYRQPSANVGKRVRADPGDQLVRLDHIMPRRAGCPSLSTATRSVGWRSGARRVAKRMKPAPEPASTKPQTS
jgi:uncharacterized protein GlcG (DUF336 family)